MREPNARQVHETEVESEPRCSTEEHVPEVELSVEEARGSQETPWNSTNSVGSKGYPVLLEMTGHETTETNLEHGTARVLIAWKLVIGVETVFEKTRNTGTSDRRKNDKTVTRSCPVHWIGTWVLETEAAIRWRWTSGKAGDSSRCATRPIAIFSTDFAGCKLACEWGSYTTRIGALSDSEALGKWDMVADGHMDRPTFLKSWWKMLVCPNLLKHTWPQFRCRDERATAERRRVGGYGPKGLDNGQDRSGRLTERIAIAEKTKGAGTKITIHGCSAWGFVDGQQNCLRNLGFSEDFNVNCPRSSCGSEGISYQSLSLVWWSQCLEIGKRFCRWQTTCFKKTVGGNIVCDTEVDDEAGKKL